MRQGSGSVQASGATALALHAGHGSTALGWRHPLITRLWPGGENPLVLWGLAAEPLNCTLTLRPAPALTTPAGSGGIERQSLRALVPCGMGQAQGRPPRIDRIANSANRPTLALPLPSRLIGIGL